MKKWIPRLLISQMTFSFLWLLSAFFILSAFFADGFAKLVMNEFSDTAFILVIVSASISAWGYLLNWKREYFNKYSLSGHVLILLAWCFFLLTHCTPAEYRGSGTIVYFILYIVPSFFAAMIAAVVALIRSE